MKNHPIIHNSYFLIILFIFLFSIHLNSQTKLFVEAERLELKLDSVAFAAIGDIKPLPDGFVLLLQQKAYGDKDLMVKLNQQGEIVRKYDKKGNGPGEFRAAENIVVTADSIFVSEFASPYVHKFDHDLSFLKDFRLKRGGKIIATPKYFGIWAVHNDDKEKYILALYDKSDLEFKHYSFKVKEVPALVHAWGGVCKCGNNSIAGVYSNYYQIQIFDQDFNHKKNILKHVPQHIKKYRPNEQFKHSVTSDAGKWLSSWSKMQAVYYINGKYIIEYSHDDCTYFDIYSEEGQGIKLNKKSAKKNIYVHFDSEYFWWIDQKTINDDTIKFYLVKDRINL